jgi:hypothetical protein
VKSYADLKESIGTIIHRASYIGAAKMLHDLLTRKPKPLKHGVEYYALQIARSTQDVEGRALAKFYTKQYK